MVKRRTYSPEFKANAVLAIISGTKTAAEICREHRIGRLTMELEITHLPWWAVPGKTLYLESPERRNRQ